MKEKIRKLCSVCGKKKVKIVTTNLGDLDYGFCGKICLANHTIKRMKLKKVTKEE